MKKLLFLLFMVTSLLQAQTYQNPTFGTVTTKTSPTVTNDPYLTTTGTTGVQGKIAPVNLLIPYTPVNYSVPNLTIGAHLGGIDTRLGQISSTTAGITQRVYFTADNTTVNSVVYFASSLSGKGATASGSPPALVLADNTKAFFTKDIISISQPSPTIGYAGTYSGNLTVSATPTPVATQQRFTVEIYRTDNLGNPIASGVSGAPTGDLGVTVLAILDSGIVNLSAGSITNVPVSGILTQNITLNTGERLRYHVSAAKIGTGGGNVTFGVYYGNAYNSYYDVPVAITTDSVLNKSAVTGVTDTDALNTLNTSKENTANKQNSLNVDGTGVKFPTVDAVSGSTVTKIPQDQSTWNNKLMILCGDSTTWQMTSLGVGFDYMTSFYRAPGNKMEKITGYVNFGSSGYSLNGFFNDAVTTPPVINTTTNTGIGTWDYYGHNIQVAIPQKTAIEYRKSIPNQEVVWVICFGINDCILYASVGNQTEEQIASYLADILNQAVLKFKLEFPKDQVILRMPNTMAARPYNPGAGFPSPTAYPTFGTDKPTDVALVTKWNNAIRKAYLLASQQNLNTILLDTHEKIFGSQSAEIDANFRPFMQDLVHPNGLGYNAVADELAYIFTDERKQKDFSRIDEAVKRSVLLSNQPYENYSNYVSNKTKYELVLNSKLTSNAGINYIDVPFTKAEFDATLLGSPFYIKKGNVTIKITTYATNVSGSICRVTGVSPSAEFQAETGSTSIYIDKPNDNNNLHKTGNEAKTGILSFNSTGATNTTGLSLTANGSSQAVSPLDVIIPSTSNGRGISITHAGTSLAKAIHLINNSTAGADGLRIDLNQTGTGIIINSAIASNAKPFIIRKNSIMTAEFNDLGELTAPKITLTTTPATSTGTYDFIVRKLDAGGLGVLEKIPSANIALSASPTFTGTAGFYIADINSGYIGFSTNTSGVGSNRPAVFRQSDRLGLKGSITNDNPVLINTDALSAIRTVTVPDSDGTLAVTLNGSATLDFPSTGSNSESNLTISVPGAAVGDVISLGAPAIAANTMYLAFVSAADTVTVRFRNLTLAAIDPASATFKVKIFK